jgi:hypothetical protein
MKFSFMARTSIVVVAPNHRPVLEETNFGVRTLGGFIAIGVPHV